MLAAPFVLTLGLGLVTGRFIGNGGSGLSDIPVVIVNLDDGQIGQALVDTFQSADLADLVEPTLGSDPEAARRFIDEDKAAAAIIIPAGFTRSIIPQQSDYTATGSMPVEVQIEVYANPQRPTSAGVIKAIVDEFLSRVEEGRLGGEVSILQMLASGRITAQQAEAAGTAMGQRLQDQPASETLAIQINSSTQGGEAVQFDALAYIAPGMALMFLMYTVSYGGRSILAERSQGTLPRLLVSPTSSAQILGGKVFGIFLTGVVQMLILILASSLIFQLKWGDALGVLLLVLAAVFAATGWGMLITATARTTAQVANTGSAVMLIFGALGGSFISLEQMPFPVQMVSKITPNAWALDGFATLGLGGHLDRFGSADCGAAGHGNGLICRFGGAVWEEGSGAEITLTLALSRRERGKSGMMKKLFAIAWKDAIIRFSSAAELLFFIILPVVFTLIMAGGTPPGDGDARIRLVVVDQAQTSVSQGILAELEKSTAVRPEVLTLDEAQNQFDARRASVVLILPTGLDLQSIQDGTAQVDLRQQPNNLNATVAARAVQTSIRRVSSAIHAADMAVQEAEANGTFESETDRQAYFNDALKLAQTAQAQTPERVTVVEGSTPDEVEYDPRANQSAGQLITWVFIPLFGISGMFAYERQIGTLRRVLTTPTAKATYLFGTIAGQVFMALIQMAILVLFGIFVMKLDWGREPLALFIVMLTSALAAAAIGTTMGTFVKSEGQANGLSTMFGMVMALMGGCWYPLELFPPVVQQIVKVLPTTWAMQGMLDLVLRGRGLLDILPEAGVLVGFAAVFFTVGVWRFRYE